MAERPILKLKSKPVVKPLEPKSVVKPIATGAKPPEPKPMAKPAAKPPEPKPMVKPAAKPPEPKPMAKPAAKPPEPKPMAKPPEPKPVVKQPVEKKKCELSNEMRDACNALYTLLTTNHPDLFPVDDSINKPWAIGIHQEIRKKYSTSLKVTKLTIARWISNHTVSYVTAMRVGGLRFNLDGEPTSEVTKEQQRSFFEANKKMVEYVGYKIKNREQQVDRPT